MLAGVILVALGGPAGADPVAAPVVAPAQQSPAKSTQAATAPAAAETGAVDPSAPSPAKPTSPPLSAQAGEAAHVAHLDEVIAPLLKYDLAAGDAPKIKGAIEALVANDAAKAAELEAGVSDAIGRKLIAWYRLRQGEGQAADYLAFLNANPDWPSRDYLRRRMEEALFLEGGSTELIATYFKDGKAVSGAGRALLASVELARGDQAKAKALASEVWRQHDLPAALEAGFLTRFGSLLTEEDHKWRLDRLLVDDVRYRANRKERAEVAKRIIPLLSAPEQKTAEARLAVFLQAAGAKSKVKAAAAKAKSSDWGLVFHKVQALRQASKVQEGAKLILTAPTDPAVVANLDEWWLERQKLAYLALTANKPKLAYDLVRDAGPISANELNEQSFMAGWIALRYLKDKAAAERHFAAFVKSADGPISRAKSHYWLARLYEAKGESAKATEEYRAAAASVDTFYGLLAMQKLDPGNRRISLSPPAEPTPEQAARFNGLDVAKAAIVARKAGLNTSIPRIIFQRLYALDDSEAWAGMVAHLARSIGDTQSAVRIGKQAIARGQNLAYYSYPVHALPDYKPLRPPPEKAVLFGLARQETEFNPDTVSGAGARGLLQIMKGTAKHVCRDYKIKCDHKQLLTDGSYNAMIASAYVADQMADFAGSYVLSIASYNAGPGRARQWIREFGDPRKAGVDPIDWIERIPIEETRHYVAKVLANIQIYRARLGEEATALRLDQDLARAREAALAPQTRKAANTDTAKSE